MQAMPGRVKTGDAGRRQASRMTAGRQVETIINWGRYAELLAYDDDSGSISLEPTA